MGIKKLFFLVIILSLLLILTRDKVRAADINTLKQELSSIQSDGNYIGALLFNAFGTNTDGSFSSFLLTDEQIATACGGLCGKIGVNSANFYSQPDSFYARAQKDGMQFTLEIARNSSDAPTVLAGLRAAHSHGATPVIRIGVIGDGGDFADVQTYITFLKAINAGIDFPVYAIAGPNEPETETWATPTCGTTDYQCIGIGLKTYMNAVIQGAGNLSNIKLLSPAFNMTDSVSAPIVNIMISNGANFNGVVAIAGNAYNIDNVPITKWVSNFMSNSGLSGKKIFLTETGNFGSVNPATAPKPFLLDTQVPCNSIADPEFHSLRPYPASPCDAKIEDTTLLCANDLVVAKQPKESTPGGACTTASDGTITCLYSNVQQSSNVSINLANAELPIFGNTEDVPNATWTSLNTSANNLTAAQRMNNYVSWYLNGVINKAEEDFSSFDENFLVNYSGPLNKLLPWNIQFIDRLTSVTNAQDTKDGKLPQNDTNARHDEFVGCPWINKVYGLGVVLPCYLTNEFLSGLISSVASSGSLIEKLAGGVLQLTTYKDGTRLTSWNSWLPPQEAKYNSFEEYWKAYLAWQGQICSPNLLGTKFYLCTGLSGAFTVWSKLFPYTPLSTTEDRVGQIGTDGTTPTGDAGLGNVNTQAGPIKLSNTVQSDSNVIAESVTFTPSSQNSTQHNLYFAHMQEDAELAQKLQSTFVSKDAIDKHYDFNPNNNQDAQQFYDVNKYPHCEIQKAKTNPGDSLHGDINRNNLQGVPETQISGTLNFNANYTCTFAPILDPVSGLIVGHQEGKCQTIYASMAIFNRTPNAQENWDREVNGAASIFKRFYPQVGPNSPVAKIEDIPGVTQASYTSSSGDKILAGNYNSQRSGDNAQVFIPYAGGVQEYFLTGIQKALRPEGFDSGTLEGAPSSTPGQDNGNPVYGSCKPEDMLAFQDGATIASCIANNESGCQSNALNDSCLTVGGTQDYSVGLFQINLIASLNRCPGAFDPKNGGSLGVYENGHAIVPCKIGDQAALDACVAHLSDPKNNTDLAASLYLSKKNNSNPWSDWAADAKACNLGQ